jgi:hypothetical protein
MEKMKFQNGRALLQFREAAAAFQMIPDEQLPVLVPYNKDAESLRDKLLVGGVAFIPQRELQPYLVSARKEAVQQMVSRGFVSEHESGIWLLRNPSLYSKDKGLDPESTRLDESIWGV